MHDTDTEKALLGIFLNNNDLKYESVLTVEDFYSATHQTMFTAMMGMESFDTITLNSATGSNHTVEILESASGYVTSASWKHYEKIIIEHSKKRKLHSMLTEQLHSLNTDNSDIVRSAVTSFIMDQLEHSKVVKASDNVTELIKDISSGDISNDGLLTGIDPIDEFLGCMAFGELYFIGARPSMGKTSLALNIVCNVADTAPTMIFALETTVKILRMRLLCILGNASMTDTMRRMNPEENIPRVVRGQHRLNELDIYIDDTCGLSVEELERKIRVAQKQYGVKFAVIDYIGLLTTTKKTNSMYETVTYISKQLKRIAKDTGVTLLVLSQLNRSLEGRPNKRPMMSDFRDSGQIEQDAEAIITIYRDEVYDEETEYRGMAEVTILKHKNGAIGVATARFDKISMIFS